MIMAAQAPNLMFFYKKLAGLNRNKHKDLRLTRISTFEFAAHTHLLPLAGCEFAAASSSFPVIFVRDGNATDDKATIVPIALLGLKPEHNDMVDDKGKWRNNKYLPAFIRRYPFVLAAEDEKSDNFTICIDEEAPHFKNDKDEGVALFDDKGENTSFLDEMIDFLQSFKQEMERTAHFILKLQDYNLFTTTNAQITNGGGHLFQIKDMLVVDETKLNALAGDKLAELARDGFLGWIYAHLLSLNTLPELLVHHEQNAGSQN